MSGIARQTYLFALEPDRLRSDHCHISLIYAGNVLIAHLVAGTFVTVLYYPFFWIQLAMIVMVNNVTQRSLEAQTGPVVGRFARNKMYAGKQRRT